MSLSCPIGVAMAAIAKQLHSTALEAEARIAVLEQQLRSAVNRPTLVRTSSAPLTGFAANIDTLINDNGGPFVTNFVNIPLPGSTPVGTSNRWSLFLGEGMYEVGMAATALASGATDVNTFRLFTINQMRSDPTVTSGLSAVDEQGHMEFDAGTGQGVEVAMTGTFRMRAGDSIFFFLTHGNTSSTLTLTAVTFWMHKLSDTTLTRVL